MATDDERREVAERLRGLNGDVSHVRRVYEAEGLSIFCDDQADYYQICETVAGYLPAEHMHPCDYEELHSRLADLIEPGDMSHGCRDTVACDRDALLALAEEMQGYADVAASGDGFPYVNAGSLWSYADRIREACGVVDAG